MPLLGKIVVIKRNGEDGTEFPLTASCLFGRKLNCDIRIQLPQVSKEHCRIDLNENKELILTNLSSVNPTLINGEALQEIERLKHGDLITIIDRSFRFEYPPPKTPKKKRLSTTGQDKTPQLEKSTPVPVEKRKSEHSFDTCLKDGSNLPQSLEQTVETAADEKPKKDSMSPFGELYQMVKQDLAAKSPWKSGLAKTPLARPQVDQVPTSDVKNNPKLVTTPSTKRRRSSNGKFEDQTGVDVPQSSTNATPEGEPADMPSVESSTSLVLEKSRTPVSQKKATPSKTPETFSAGEVVQQILLEPQPEEKTPRSPKRRRSGASQDQTLALQISSSQPQTPGPEEKNTDVKMSPRTSPRANAGKRFQVQDILSEITEDTQKTQTDVAIRQSRKKRVSFGGQLSPELFDKCLPPNSPLHRGATPRRSLGPSQKPLSLLRRASTIGLLALRLEETDTECAKAQSSPAKKASPKRAASTTKTPSPAKRSPRAKTPSQKPQKSPSGAAKASSPSSTTASPKTPASSRRSSSSSIEAAGNGSAIDTPKVQGRFSVSRISTPSPVQDQMEEGKAEPGNVEDMPQVSGTPTIPLRRKSMKSARKTPKSAMESALNVMRSRRSGASHANLKVLNSWADIVKFGQAKPHTDVTTKKTTKCIVVKRTVVPKPKTPARRLKEDLSTGHAMSPVTLVVGKAHLRTNQSVGTAPKIVPNIAVLKKDMKMDEDLTGIADIFKTPANKSKNMAGMNTACPETPLDEFSVMKTPEESGEMIVSPLSVVSTTKRENYKNEAVTRLLLDNQEDSLLNEDGLLQPADNSNDAQESVEMAESDQTEEEESVPEAVVKTPQQAAVPSLCLTGVKRLMKTPRQRAEPIEDLRGKLLKTPKAPKYPQEESLEGVKELLKTPKQGGVPVEDMVGEIKRLTQTPQENNPVLSAAGNEDITAVEELMETPKVMERTLEEEEDLTGLKQLMKTPKHKGEPVEKHLGLKRLMQTPKEKIEPLEDLAGLKQLMKTPKHKGEPVGNHLGVSKLLKTPRQNGAAAEEEFTGLKETVEEPESSSTQNNVTESFETLEPVPAVENDAASMPAKDFEMECDKENVCPVEPMETKVFESVDLPCTAEAFDSQLKIESVAVVLQVEHCDQTKEEPVSGQDIDVCSSEVDEKTKEQTEETTSDNSGVTVESTQPSCTAEQEEEEAIKPSLTSKPQRGSQGRAAQKSKAPAVLSIIEESAPPPPSPGRGRRGKKLLEVPEVAASPLRKSARGRVSKPSFEVEEVKITEAVQVPVASMKTEVSDSQPEITKTKNGRTAQKDDAEIEPVEDASALGVQCSDVPAPAVKEEHVQVTVPKAGRRRMNKMESQPSEEPQQITETVSEENAVTTESVSLQTSEVDEAPITATRARRGRQQKKENVKTEPTPSLGSDMTSTQVDVKPPAKSGRGRTSKKETIKDQTVDDEPKVEAAVDSQDEPEAPVVKSARGRRAKQQKPQMAEDVDNQSVADASTHATVTEEYPEIEVKSVRNGRRAKQMSKEIPVEAEENIVSVSEQAKVPVVKATRRRPIAKEPESVADVPVRRGRRAAVDPTPPVAVVSGRGRKAAVKVELEVAEDVASSEEQVKSIKQTRRTAKVPESKKVSSESVADENTVPDKVGRATRGKKEKGSTKDTAKTQMNDSVTPEEDTVTKNSKTVNWSTALVTSKEIDDFETSTDEAPLKKSKKLDKSSAKTICTESDQSTDQPIRGRRGRGARKEEEASVEDLHEEPHMKAKPVRRGKAAASAAPKAEPNDIKASTPMKRKRSEPLEVTEDPGDKELLPKRRGRVANSTEVVSRKEKTLEPEPTPKTTSKRTTRGQNKKLQEPDPAPLPAQESVSGTRKARGVKKAEAADISIEAAPVRRTRRK